MRCVLVIAGFIAQRPLLKRFALKKSEKYTRTRIEAERGRDKDEK